MWLGKSGANYLGAFATVYTAYMFELDIANLDLSVISTVLIILMDYLYIQSSQGGGWTRSERQLANRKLGFLQTEIQHGAWQ